MARFFCVLLACSIFATTVAAHPCPTKSPQRSGSVTRTVANKPSPCSSRHRHVAAVAKQPSFWQRNSHWIIGGSALAAGLVIGHNLGDNAVTTTVVTNVITGAAKSATGGKDKGGSGHKGYSKHCKK